MFGINNYGSFIVTVLVFLAIPGPGLLGILAATGKGGVRSGFVATLGVVVGDWIHMALAGLGVAALLQANPLAFKLIQYFGAAYLIYIGIKLVIDKVATEHDFTVQLSRQHFRRVFLITLMNPKAIVFYMAFFPLFIDPARHHGATTLLAMALTVSMLTILFCSSFVIVAKVISTKLRNNRYLAILAQRTAGLFLIGFGIKLTTN